MSEQFTDRISDTCYTGTDRKDLFYLTQDLFLLSIDCLTRIRTKLVSRLKLWEKSRRNNIMVIQVDKEGIGRLRKDDGLDWVSRELDSKLTTIRCAIIARSTSKVICDSSALICKVH